MLLMIRGPREGLAKLYHREADLPAVMAGRYLCFLVMTVLAVAYGDLMVMLGLQFSFLVAALVDTWIYWRGGHRYGPHLMAGLASAVAAVLLVCALVT